VRGERVGGAGGGRCGLWSKYPDPAEGPEVGGGREGSARWERPPSSKEETEGVSDGTEELPLLMEAGVEGSVSSDRKLALLIAGFGIGGPVLDIGWAPNGGGWCLINEDCCWMWGPWIVG